MCISKSLGKGRLHLQSKAFGHASHLNVVCFPKTYQNTDSELDRCSQDLTYLSNTIGYALHCNEWLTKLIAICSKMSRFVNEESSKCHLPRFLQ